VKGEASERCMRPGETTVRDDDVECNGRSVWRWLETGLRLIRSGDSSSRGASDIDLVGGTEQPSRQPSALLCTPAALLHRCG